MSLMSVLDRVTRRSPTQRRGPRLGRGPRQRPRPPSLELLEGRLCLSEVTINATTSGYWDQFGKHIQETTNYEVGRNGKYDYHDFFVFDLSNVSGTITGASLVLHNSDEGFKSVNSPLTVTFVSVNTPINQLTTTADRATANVGIWQDLGGLNGNAVYGTYTATAADDGTNVTVPLTDAALADLNAAEGGQIAIGGFIAAADSDTTSNPQAMFYDTQSPRNLRQLVLTVADNGPSGAGGAATIHSAAVANHAPSRHVVHVR